MTHPIFRAAQTVSCLLTVRLLILSLLALPIIGFAQSPTQQSTSSKEKDDEPVAWVEEMQGEVLVRQDEKTVTAYVEMPLFVGNVVATRELSEVIIRFENGCKLRLPENQVTEIEHASACCHSDIDEEEDEYFMAFLHKMKGEVTVFRNLEPIFRSGTGPNAIQAPMVDSVNECLKCRRRNPETGETFEEYESPCLQTGDIVQTGDDSSTFIRYCDGCAVKLEENEQHEMRFATECCILGCFYPITPAVPIPVGGTIFGISPGIVVPGTLIGIGTTVIINDDDDSPASPQ